MEQKNLTTTIIGLGLIGGTMAWALRDQGLSGHIIGVDNNEEHSRRALELGIIDELLTLEEAVKAADLIILAIPVTAAAKLLPELLNMVDHQVITDVGSTKRGLVLAAEGHPRRGRYVPAHPMWGTEFSGPDAASRNVLEGVVNIICDPADSDKDALSLVEYLLTSLGMRIVYMDSLSHDTHLAYVSHISHISSFALANTVLEKEKEEDTIFNLASSGFESTVRLAKSNSATWVPVFKQNKENVLDVLNEYISQLRKFKASLEKENWSYLNELIESSNKIRKVLDKKQGEKQEQKKVTPNK
ncbi:prephenate dehydrogenase [Arachidicoccus rhizosphaerae]|jgi:prephenate dehydrogenase|uniref:Prephenate dehydrogenase n=1 Tax=Arachidicoccus rhizosphaerae TaxID=551991 RepID=A0A1H3W7T2_9BACT|nr:prephenate dehydrogenase [Arachidicoccus rhizosphaerae]SDZ83137.1 prephenate dehydrogenase [Arachidicoccus rhizosphaerae]